MKNTTRKAALAMMVVLAAAIAVPAAGGQGFYDLERSISNHFESGALDLRVGWTESRNDTSVENQSLTDNPDAIFNVTDIQPGEFGEATIGLHLRDNPGWLWIDFEQTGNAENNVLPSENDDTNSTGELGDYLKFFLWYDDGDNIYENETVVFNGTAHELGEMNKTLLDAAPSNSQEDSFFPFVTHYIGMEWRLDEEVCEVQTDSKTFDITFSTQQERHNSEPGSLDSLFTDVERSLGNTFQAGNFSSCASGDCGPVMGFRDEGTAMIERVNGNSSHMVEYTTVLDNPSTVKFEDAENGGHEVGLGEDGEVETETFNITVENGHDFFVVKTKAGQEEGVMMLSGVGDSGMESSGLFNITFVDMIENGDGTTTYIVNVTSDGEEGRNSPALSHITFEFCLFDFQVDLVEGEPIRNLSNTSYHGEDRMIRYHHGNNEEGLIGSFGAPEQPDGITSSPFEFNASTGMITAFFTVENDTDMNISAEMNDSRKVTLAVYLKPFEGWIGSRADEQMLYDYSTMNYSYGNHSTTVEVPVYNMTETDDDDDKDDDNGNGKPDNPGGGKPDDTPGGGN